jgi:hypothetical protein
MADNYLQFAVAINLHTCAERTWCTEMLAALTELLGSCGEQIELLNKLGELGHRAVDEDWGFLGFDWRIEQPKASCTNVGTKLCLYAEESGAPEQLAAFLQTYLAKFQPTGVVTFSWSYTCSKIRSGEFGGGAAVVTATASRFIDAQSWAEDQVRK